MTYRERWQRLHPEEDVSELHLEACPDIFGDIPEFRCPCSGGRTDPGVCLDCWDSQIPGMEEELPTPEESAKDKSTARVLVETIGDSIHMSADGDTGELILCALAAVHAAAKEIYDSAEDKLAAEEIIHTMQNLLSPTGKIWCFDDK